MAIAPIIGRFAPPVQDPPIQADGKQHSQAWVEYNQRIADYLHNLPQIVKAGVTDDTEAAPGQIGEYIEEHAFDIVVPDGAATSVVEFEVPPGDWDLRGYAFWKPDGGVTPQALSTSLSETLDTEGDYPTLIQATSLIAGANAGQWVGPQRVKVSAQTSWWLVCKCEFTGGGGMYVSGNIFARRVR